MADDTLKENSSNWGGARPGAGRPQGSMNQTSKDRMAVKRAYQERILKVTDHIFNAQYNLATGEQYLFWKHKVGSGTKERTVVEVVDNIEVIKAFLNDELDTEDDEYYYLSTKPANGMALDSMLDRAFGKADSKLDVTSNGETLGGISPEQAEQLIRARANRSDT